MNCMQRIVCSFMIFLTCGLIKVYSQENISYIQGDSLIILRFSEKVDLNSATNPLNYTMQEGISVRRVIYDAFDYRSLVLVCDQILNENEYTLLVSNIYTLNDKENPIPSFSLSVSRDPEPWWNLPEVLKENVEHKSFWSLTHQRLIGFNVYIPDYDIIESDSIPVIYFLGGLGNDENKQYPMWIDLLENAIKEGNLPPTALVFPNPMPASWYLDGDKYQTETMIIKELIPLIDTTYGFYTQPEGRWISGFSMGGFGSLHYAFSYPELFGSVVSYSAARDVQVPLPEKITENKQLIVLSVGESDFYFISTVLPIYNTLQNLSIPTFYKGLPGVDHSIYHIFRQVGIENISRQWEKLGGFNRRPQVFAGNDTSILFHDDLSLSLNPRITDDFFQEDSLIINWKSISDNAELNFSDSTILEPEVRFMDEADYILVLEVSDKDFSSTDTVVIKVSSHPENYAPIVELGKDTLINQKGVLTTFPVRIKDDGLPEDSDLKVAWNLFPSEGSEIHSFSNDDCTISLTKVGSYYLICSVDDMEKQSSDSLLIELKDENFVFPHLYFSLNEGTGIYSRDLINDEKLNLSNTKWQSEGGVTSLVFDGSSGYGHLPEPNGVSYSERTIILQFRTSNSRAMYQTLYDEGDVLNGIAIGKYGGILQIDLAHEGVTTSLKGNFNYTRGWQYVAVRITENQMSLFLNDRMIGQKSIETFTPSQNDRDIYIGASGNTTAHGIAGGHETISQFLDGSIDYVQIYNEALSDSIILTKGGYLRTILSPLAKQIPAIWPNPAKDQLWLRMPANVSEIEIGLVDIMGRMILTREVKSNNQDIFSFSIPELKAGTYILIIKDEMQLYQTKLYIQ